ncbi:MAG: peptidoglycan DD-metalloendopeptidase family protein [Myxococcales bacterium]|nr:peptidoglycan DD-metalloendopeptidase family protein [Myxococcales bacterium]MCB9552573.1 peptidoglycan DD-metalloendopeptidase family protein [Myxococcales bacterium]
MPVLRDTPPRKPLPLGTLLAGVVVFSTAIGLVVMVHDAPTLPPATDAGPDAHLHTRLDPPPPPTADRPPPTAAPIEAPPAAPLSPFTTHEGVLDRDQTLSSALGAYGVTPAQVHRIVAALDGIYDFRTARPGAGFSVRIDNRDGSLAGFRFEHGPLDVFEVERDGDGFTGKRVEVPTETVEAAIGAEIRASLYRAMQRIGESPGLVAEITDVFAWDIDFYRNTHPGDRFRVIVQKIEKDGELIRYGRIIAAEYIGQVGTFRTFYFHPEGAEEGHYYLEDGQSAEKTFLATPLKFTRVSSGFNRRRKHPVLGYTKAHLGVDYAAPTGTPVWAMAAGTVTFAGWKGPNGKLVRIDHGNGLQSAYAHLHRIAAGIKPGARVRQKQIIGAVGTTGRSTGPHLHFAIKQGGKEINPATLKVSRGKPVAAAHREAFDAHVAALRARLEQIAVSAAPVEEVDDPEGADEVGAIDPGEAEDAP